MSNNLNLPQVAAGQNQKEITINEQAARLDAALTGLLLLDVSGGDANPSAEELRQAASIFVSGADGSQTVNLPTVQKTLIVLSSPSNVGDFNVGRGVTSLTLTPGEGVFLVLDGTPDGLFEVR